MYIGSATWEPCFPAPSQQLGLEGHEAWLIPGRGGASLSGDFGSRTPLQPCQVFLTLPVSLGHFSHSSFPFCLTHRSPSHSGGPPSLSWPLLHFPPKAIPQTKALHMNPGLVVSGTLIYKFSNTSSCFIVFLALTTKDDLKWNPYSVFYQAIEVLLGHTQVWETKT